MAGLHRGSQASAASCTAHHVPIRHPCCTTHQSCQHTSANGIQDMRPIAVASHHLHGTSLPHRTIVLPSWHIARSTNNIMCKSHWQAMGFELLPASPSRQRNMARVQHSSSTAHHIRSTASTPTTLQQQLSTHTALRMNTRCICQSATWVRLATHCPVDPGYGTVQQPAPEPATRLRCFLACRACRQHKQPPEPAPPLLEVHSQSQRANLPHWLL